MKSFIVLILAVTCVMIGFAKEPVHVNFNLVQVNHYPGQEELQDEVVTPGKRLVIDMNEPNSMFKYLTATSSIPIRMRIDNAYRSLEGGAVGAALGWGTSAILYAPARQDSFLVTSSRTGCPGTEVAPSVSVAFSNGRQWSDPPIRFGPLTEMTVCPLGNGYQLEVNGRGTLPPLVRVIADRTSFGRR